MQRAEVLCALGVLALAGLVLRESARLNIGWGPSGPGAGFFPFWLAVALAASALTILVRAFSKRGASSAESARFLRAGALPSLLKVILPIVGMVLMMQVVGFYVAAALYLGFVMRWLGRHGWPLVIGVSLRFRWRRTR